MWIVVVACISTVNLLISCTRSQDKNATAKSSISLGLIWKIAQLRALCQAQFNHHNKYQQTTMSKPMHITQRLHQEADTGLPGYTQMQIITSLDVICQSLKIFETKY